MLAGSNGPDGIMLGGSQFGLADGLVGGVFFVGIEGEDARVCGWRIAAEELSPLCFGQVEIIGDGV